MCILHVTFQILDVIPNFGDVIMATSVLRSVGIFHSNPIYFHCLFKSVDFPWLPKMNLDEF
jgi:hypothetical protein